MARRATFALFVLTVAVLSYRLQAQSPVTYERLQNAAKEPHNWLTYGGDYFSHRHSTLTQITPANVKNLNLAWVQQSPAAGSWQATPLVVDGIMYLTQRPNDVMALDAATGRVFWVYRMRTRPTSSCAAVRITVAWRFSAKPCSWARSTRTSWPSTHEAGRPIWKTQVAESKAGYSVTVSPLVVKDKVIVGVGGGEYGIRGFIAAYDAHTGKEVWRFYTIPGPGEPGHETWEQCPPNSTSYCDPEAWKHGGGSVWVTGSYDPI